MQVNELMEELKEFKHSEINFYSFQTRVIIKGFLKKVYSEAENEISFDIREIKSDDTMLKKHSCKSCNKEKANTDDNDKKDRKTIGFKELEKVEIEKSKQRNKVLYTLKFPEGEDLGIIIIPENSDKCS